MAEKVTLSDQDIAEIKTYGKDRRDEYENKRDTIQEAMRKLFESLLERRCHDPYYKRDSSGFFSDIAVELQGVVGMGADNPHRIDPNESGLFRAKQAVAEVMGKVFHTVEERKRNDLTSLSPCFPRIIRQEDVGDLEHPNNKTRIGDIFINEHNKVFVNTGYTREQIKTLFSLYLNNCDYFFEEYPSLYLHKGMKTLLPIKGQDRESNRNYTAVATGVFYNYIQGNLVRRTNRNDNPFLLEVNTENYPFALRLFKFFLAAVEDQRDWHVCFDMAEEVHERIKSLSIPASS